MKKLALLFFVLIIIATGCKIINNADRSDSVMNPGEEINKPGTESIILTAAGDILMHNTLIWSGQEGDGAYNFDSFFSEVRGLINEGDYSTIDLESPLAGPDSGYTGYPLFNSPDAAASALKNAGFDLVVTANNHMLDRGYKGAIRTMSVLKQAGLDYVGTYASKEDSHYYHIVDIRGVKVGYIAYSYSTNGMVAPEDKQYFFNYLDRDKILDDIKALRPQVDVLVLILHWGIEYTLNPTLEQKLMARQFLEAGADIILGNHPHVIQPAEIMNIQGKTKLVAYAMGNFIGDQHGTERNSGMVLKMIFTKDFNTGETYLDKVSYTPTFVQKYMWNGHEKFRVVPIEESIEKIKQNSDPLLTKANLNELQEALDATRDQMGPYLIKS